MLVNTVVKLIVHKLINNATISNTCGVKGRVRPHAHAEEKHPDYPSIYVYYDTSRHPGGTTAAGLVYITISAWSNQSYTECHEIQDHLVGNDKVSDEIIPILNGIPYTKGNDMIVPEYSLVVGVPGKRILSSKESE